MDLSIHNMTTWGIKAVSVKHEASRLTDPHFCLEQAERLLIPVNDENWALVKDEASELNILQASLVHRVYLDTERTEFQEKVMEIIFTAYLMGRTAEERIAGPVPESFLELIQGLDLSALPEPEK